MRGVFIINSDQVVPKWGDAALVFTPTHLHINTNLTQVWRARVARGSAGKRELASELSESLKSLISYACGQFNDGWSGRQMQICHIITGCVIVLDQLLMGLKLLSSGVSG